jgi:pseudouridine-5'-phosphate glycosidase
MLDALTFSEEVADARAAGRPVVALESTVIAHGLPAPDNLETAAAMEAAARDGGAVPATIAVMDGRIRVGLDAAGRARLADPDRSVAKLSRRDIAACLVDGGIGATTVSATLICARAAGIQVFSTGGIGGVHRGAEHSFDISADLAELARAPLVTVCSGAKGILDLSKTREALETLGVPVLGYGTDRLPAFHAAATDLPVDRRVETGAEVAAIASAHWTLGLGGVLVANPVPAAAAIPSTEVDGWIAEALAAAEAEGVSGGSVTPYLLRHIAARSGGRSLVANKALLVDNARVGAAVARALALPRADIDLEDRP